MRSRTGRAVLALVCIAVMLVAVNVVAAGVPSLRLDLTQEHLYTPRRRHQADPR